MKPTILFSLTPFGLFNNHFADKKYSSGGAISKWNYFVVDNGEYRSATKSDYKYWYDNFGAEVMDKHGNVHKKGSIPFSDVENIYNPQGVMIAEKTAVKASGGGIFSKSPKNYLMRYLVGTSPLERSDLFSTLEAVEEAFEKAKTKHSYISVYKVNPADPMNAKYWEDIHWNYGLGEKTSTMESVNF